MLDNASCKQNGLRPATLAGVSYIDIARALIAEQQVEINRLKGDISRLRKYSARALGSDPQSCDQCAKQSKLFANICQGLSLLLDSVHAFGFELSDEGIINRAARPGSSPVVPSSLLLEFREQDISNLADGARTGWDSNPR